MNYEHYKVFLYVAKYKSATRAAKELFTSQPAVTRSIKLLEDDLGCHLFIRSKYGMELTSEGETLFNYVNSGFSIIEQGEEIVSKTTSVDSGQISIGSTITALDEFLFEFIGEFHDKHPNVKYKLFTQSSNQTIQKLTSGQIDIAFITTPYLKSDSQTMIRIKDFENVAVAGNSFKYLKDKSLSLEDLSKLPFVLLNQHMQLREYVDELFQKHNLYVEPTVEIDSAHMITKMVKNNYGIGITPLSLVEESIKKGEIFTLKLKEPLPLREVVAIIDKNHPQSPLLKTFINELKKTK